MPNHNGSHSMQELSGSTGPVESAWEVWKSQNAETFNINESNEAAVKYCFMCSAVHIYNLFMETLRTDPSLSLMTKISADIKRDFDLYFQPSTKPN